MGGGRGCYAGQPMTFRCSCCKRGYDYRNDQSAGVRVEATGRTRQQRSQGMDRHNWGDTAYEYRCLDCGHVGWSRHPSVARRFKNRGEE